MIPAGTLSGFVIPLQLHLQVIWRVSEVYGVMHIACSTRLFRSHLLQFSKPQLFDPSLFKAEGQIVLQVDSVPLHGGVISLFLISSNTCCCRLNAGNSVLAQTRAVRPASAEDFLDGRLTQFPFAHLRLVSG